MGLIPPKPPARRSEKESIRCKGCGAWGESGKCEYCGRGSDVSVKREWRSQPDHIVRR